MGLLDCLSGCFAPARFGFPGHTFVKPLGYGNEGIVWLVRDEATGVTSAMKLVRRGFTTFYAGAIADEVATLQRLSAGAGHVHVVSATILWMSPTHLGMEMAYAAGGTLDQYQARSGAVQGGVRVLPEHEAVYFVAQLLSALAYCHSRRIVFRDVKPENCVLDVAKPPRLAICDFGVSRHFSKKAAVSMHTIAGTPGFLAPDVMAQMFVRGEKSGYDGRAADIWSSGAVLCKLLTGHLPYAWDHELSDTWDTNAAMHRVWAAARAAPMRDFLESPELCSPAAIEAMEAMMHFDGATRPCATACLLLPFFAEAQLPPPYVAAMARAAAEQAAREAEHAADPPRRLGGSKTSPGDWRDCKMRAFVARAVRPGPGEKVEHLALLGLAAGSMRSEVGSPRVSVDMTPERCLSPPARLMADAITQSPSRPASCAQLDEAEAPNST